MTMASATQLASKMICTDNVCRLNTSERVDGDDDSKEDNPSPSVAAEDEAPSTNKSTNTGDGADDATTEKVDAQESAEKNPMKNREEDGKPATRNNNTTKNKSLISKIHSQQDIDLRLQSSSTSGKEDDYETPMLLLVEFKTIWCGACKGIQPLYEELASKYVDTIQCSQVMCDSKNKETKKLVSKYKIGSYPVFILFDETGNQIDRWEGADTGKLQKIFEKYQGGGFKKGKGGGKKKKGGGSGKRR